MFKFEFSNFYFLNSSLSSAKKTEFFKFKFEFEIEFATLDKTQKGSGRQRNFVPFIAKFVPSPKDSVKKDELSGLICQVPCADCNFVYIGQTKRVLKPRSTEYKRCVKYQRPEQLALCEHSMIMNHKIDWENTII